MAADAGILSALRGGLIVSVQPVPGSAMDRDDIVTAMAIAAVEGGAAGLRIEGAARVHRVRNALPQVPLVGLAKRDLKDSDVRITPLPEDVRDLLGAGGQGGDGGLGRGGTLRHGRLFGRPRQADAAAATRRAGPLRALDAACYPSTIRLVRQLMRSIGQADPQVSRANEQHWPS